MLQNVLAGFDILGVGTILGSLALLWGFWKVLHDDLQLENASRPAAEFDRARPMAPAPNRARPRAPATAAAGTPSLGEDRPFEVPATILLPGPTASAAPAPLAPRAMA